MVLVSACLLGQAVRYDGNARSCGDEILQRWLREGRVLPVCPEVAGGMPVPRLPAEIERGAGGADVLAGTARVLDLRRRDVTEAFLDGAMLTVESALARQVKVAVLKESSPSCGTDFIYDGSFSGRKVMKPGVTAALLQQAGVQVFSERQLAKADAALRFLERSGTRAAA